MMINREIVKRISRMVEDEEDATIKLIRDLISFPSIPGKEKECAEFCANKLREIGLQVDMWEPDIEELKRSPGFSPVEMNYKGRPNVVGILKGEKGGRSLLFNGHTDVIPPGPLEFWRHHPWKGEIEDGKIYGRGACDMKGGIAAMIKAVECVKNLGLSLKGDLIVECVVDEENGGNGTLASILRGYRADAGIFCEGWGKNKIVIGHRGATAYRITLTGQTAPVGRRGEVVNIIAKMAKICEALKSLETCRLASLSHPLYERYLNYVPILIGKIQGGFWRCAVPLKCTIEGTIGLLPGEDLRKVQGSVRKYIQKVSEGDPWLKNNPPKVEFPSHYIEPCDIPCNHPLVQTLQRISKEATGEEPEILAVNCGADQRLRILYGQTPSVQFGPGGGNSHGPDEYVLISEVLTCVTVLALTILEWCGYKR